MLSNPRKDSANQSRSHHLVSLLTSLGRTSRTSSSKPSTTKLPPSAVSLQPINGGIKLANKAILGANLRKEDSAITRSKMGERSIFIQVGCSSLVASLKSYKLVPMHKAAHLASSPSPFLWHVLLVLYRYRVARLAIRVEEDPRQEPGRCIGTPSSLCKPRRRRLASSRVVWCTSMATLERRSPTNSSRTSWKRTEDASSE